MTAHSDGRGSKRKACEMRWEQKMPTREKQEKQHVEVKVFPGTWYLVRIQNRVEALRHLLPKATHTALLLCLKA